MLKHVLLASAALALLAAPSFAVTPAETTSVLISGSVAPKCVITNPVSTLTFASDLAAADGSVASVSIDTGTVTGGAWCNAFGNSISISAPPLANTSHASAPTGFVRIVNYTLTGAVGGVPVGSLPSSATPYTLSMGPFDQVESGVGTVTTTADAGHKLVAGAYSATVTVSITPGL